jgi:hypothetical protein
VVLSGFRVAIELLSLDRIEQKPLAHLYQYWLHKRGTRFAPARADIDPLELKFILPQILVFDVLEGGLDFRARIAGTGTYALHNADITGDLLSTLQPKGFSDAIMDHYRAIIAHREPTYSRTGYWEGDYEAEAYHALRLPLSANGRDIDMILVGEDYGASPYKLFEKMVKASD